MAVVEQGGAVTVVAGEAAAGVGAIIHQRQEFEQIVLGRALADHDRHPPAKLLPSFLKLG